LPLDLGCHAGLAAFTALAAWAARPVLAARPERAALRSAIAALAAPGSPIYWRVLGKTSAVSTKVYPSADNYTFTVGP